MSKPNGVVLYEGPSQIDGKPIVAIATGLVNRSTNKKTGPMIQVWIFCQSDIPTAVWNNDEHFSVCGGCRHGHAAANSCYVNLAQGPNGIWKAWKNGRYQAYSGNFSALNATERDQILDLFDAESVRFGAFGEPSAVPYSVWEPILARVRDSGGRYTAYTHQWRTCDPRFKQMAVASVDSPQELEEARQAGWRTFRTLLPDEKLERGEFMCPATDEIWVLRRKQTTCLTCGACDGLNGRSSNRGSAVIRVHGLGWKVQNYIRVRGQEVALNGQENTKEVRECVGAGSG